MKNNNIDMDFYDVMFLLLIIVGIIYALGIIFGDNADAYYTVKARTIINKSNTVKTLPNQLLIDRNTIDVLLKCHASEGVLAYQSGYADACDYMFNVLGIKLSPFRSRPAPIIEKNINKIIFNYDFKQFPLNLSLYGLKYNNIWLNETVIFYNKRNFTLNKSIEVMVYGR